MTSELSDLSRIQAFLYAEAELLEQRDYPTWLDLFTQDCVYWWPIDEGETDPTRTVSIVYDDWQTLRERVWRIEGGLAYAQQPASRTSRLISNVVATGLAHDADEVVTVSSRFVVTEFREDTQVVHAGRQDHELVASEGSYLIRAKTVRLVSSLGHLGNLSILL